MDYKPKTNRTLFNYQCLNYYDEKNITPLTPNVVINMEPTSSSSSTNGKSRRIPNEQDLSKPNQFAPFPLPNIDSETVEKTYTPITPSHAASNSAMHTPLPSIQTRKCSTNTKPRENNVSQLEDLTATTQLNKYTLLELN